MTRGGQLAMEPSVDPEAVFDSPEQIVDAPGLSSKRKLELLDHWEFTVKGRLDAASEGMAVSGTQEADESELVRRIGKAKASLGDERT